jgi:uncharacterized membrane protein YuzA (DUF378 family)
MELIKRFEPFALLVMMLGALNWGVVGLTDGDTNVLDDVFTGTLLNVVYVVIGVAALVYIPRLIDALNLGGTAHPRGT